MPRCKSLEDIVENGLCIGCGLCVSVAGHDRLAMRPTPEGVVRPAKLKALDQATTERILQVCPGISIDAPATTIVPSIDDVDFGPIARLHKGYAGDEEMRFIGASGGTLTALADFLIETKEVDFVLHVRADPTAPIRSIATTSSTRAEVLAAAGSRYGPVAPLERLDQCLSGKQRFAVIAKPCDIAALRALGKTDQRVRALIPYMLTMVCGGVPHLSNTDRIIGKFGLKEEDVRLLRYRGHGWPGLTRIEALDGRVFEQTYNETWCGPEGYSLQFRCKICPDSIGLSADIVIADPWLPEAPRAEFRDGWSSILARTEAGVRLLENAERAGCLKLYPYSLAELRTSQVYHSRRRSAVIARLVGLMLAGSPLPKFRGVRLFRSALQSSLRAHFENLKGTFRRVRAGSGKEKMPNSNPTTLAPTPGHWDASEGSWT